MVFAASGYIIPNASRARRRLSSHLPSEKRTEQLINQISQVSGIVLSQVIVIELSELVVVLFVFVFEFVFVVVVVVVVVDSRVALCM